jgi:hypothetical protein
MLAGTESNAQPMRGEPEVNTWRSIVLPSQANRQVNCITIESCSLFFFGFVLHQKNCPLTVIAERCRMPSEIGFFANYLT